MLNIRNRKLFIFLWHTIVSCFEGLGLKASDSRTILLAALIFFAALVTIQLNSRVLASNTCNVTVYFNDSPSSAGSISESFDNKTYLNGQSATYPCQSVVGTCIQNTAFWIAAKPTPGYVFWNWTLSGPAKIDNSSASQTWLTFTATKTSTISLKAGYLSPYGQLIQSRSVAFVGLLSYKITAVQSQSVSNSSVSNYSFVGIYNVTFNLKTPTQVSLNSHLTATGTGPTGTYSYSGSMSSGTGANYNLQWFHQFTTQANGNNTFEALSASGSAQISENVTRSFQVSGSTTTAHLKTYNQFTNTTGTYSSKLLADVSRTPTLITNLNGNMTETEVKPTGFYTFKTVSSGQGLNVTGTLPNGTTIDPPLTQNLVGSDPSFCLGGACVDYPQWLNNPPYPWWTWISSTPALHLYLSPQLAINTAEVIIVVTAITGLLSALGSGGTLVFIGLIAGYYFTVNYVPMYGIAKNSDNSMDMWFPIDWYSSASASWGYAYAATWHIWWVMTGFGAYYIASR